MGRISTFDICQGDVFESAKIRRFELTWRMAWDRIWTRAVSRSKKQKIKCQKLRCDPFAPPLIEIYQELVDVFS